MTVEDAVDFILDRIKIYRYEVDYHWPIPDLGLSSYDVAIRRRCSEQIMAFLPRGAAHDPALLHEHMELLPLGGRFSPLQIRKTDLRLLEYLGEAWDDPRKMRLILAQATLKDLLGDGSRGYRAWDDANNRVGRQMLRYISEQIPDVWYHHACVNFLPRLDNRLSDYRLVPPDEPFDWAEVVAHQVAETFGELDLCRITIHPGLEDVGPAP